MPFYAARLRDLTWAPTVTVRCTCGHEAEVAVEVLRRRLPPSMAFSDLHRHLRCAKCDEKGWCEIDARRALGYDRLG